MIAWLFKNWKLFLDIIIVVGAIILLTIFDPFGIFSNRSLKNTANLLSSVKDIGELVTAEYYGEVISSLQGTQIYDLELDTLSNKLENCFIDLKYLLSNAIFEEMGDKARLKNSEKRKLLKDILSKKLDDLKKEYAPNNIYNHLIAFIGYNNIRNDASQFYNADKQELINKAEDKVCEYLLGEIYQILENTEDANRFPGNPIISGYIYTIPDYFDGVVDFHYELNREQIKKKRRDIVFIGRGWVKAGYKFNKLDKSNFYYDSNNKIIRFYGLSPVILDNDINPWFIPEKKVKGFELVDFYKKATFEEAKEVKIRCKQELLEQANTADILNQAQVNGEESLRDFFVLLTNEPDLKVEFRSLPFQKELNAISSDTLITVKEALLIDSIVQKLIVKINESISPEKENYEEQLTIFTNQLKEFWFLEKDIPFNMFMTEAAKILDHKLFVTITDYDTLRKLRKPIEMKVNSSVERYLTAAFPNANQYNSPYPDFVTYFNSMLNVLENEVAKVDELRGDTLRLDSMLMKRNRIDSTFFKIFEVKNTVAPDTFIYYKVLHKNIKRDFKFTDLKYPVLSIPAASYDTIQISDTIKVAPMIDTLIHNTDIFTGDPLGDTLRKDDLKTIKEYELWKIKYEIKTRPVKRLTSSIKKIFN